MAREHGAQYELHLEQRDARAEAAPVAPDDTNEHFSFLGAYVSLDNPTSSALTRQRLGWEPTHPGLIEDLDDGHYFDG